MAPIKMNRPYVLITPVSMLASCRDDVYSDCDRPCGPTSSITPRSRTLDVDRPSDSAGEIIYLLYSTSNPHLELKNL